MAEFDFFKFAKGGMENGRNDHHSNRCGGHITEIAVHATTANPLAAVRAESKHQIDSLITTFECGASHGWTYHLFIIGIFIHWRPSK